MVRPALDGSLSRQRHMYEIPNFFGRRCTPSVANSMLQTYFSRASLRRTHRFLHLTQGRLWSVVMSIAWISTQKIFAQECSGNHRRNLKKGQNHGLRISNISDLEALDIHCDLVMESLRRRKSKAEKVDVSVNRPMIEALLTSGCAEIWQATHDDHCHSSIVLLRSANVAYYHSAGTAAQGRKSGASVTLILSVAEQLRSEDVKIFNLGGAGAESAGLRRFKQGFGAKEIGLGRAHIKLVSDPIRLFRRIRRRISRSG